MNAVYLESSAALAWLLGESAAPRIAKVLRQAELVLTSTLTILETRRALCRLHAARKITAVEERKLLGLITEQARHWGVMELTGEIQTRAGERFPVEPVRSLDAIHLATTLELVQVYPTLQVATFDDRIRANLEPLGLHGVAFD